MVLSQIEECSQSVLNARIVSESSLSGQPNIEIGRSQMSRINASQDEDVAQFFFGDRKDFNYSLPEILLYGQMLSAICNKTNKSICVC